MNPQNQIHLNVVTDNTRYNFLKNNLHNAHDDIYNTVCSVIRSLGKKAHLILHTSSHQLCRLPNQFTDLVHGCLNFTSRSKQRDSGDQKSEDKTKFWLCSLFMKE
uniref:Uncharacterized protein n=1 Tax=Anguilla anguilla TaxID=7936 RepID=A0A0E9VUJ5_ANGAN